MIRQFRVSSEKVGFVPTIYDWNRLPQFLFPDNFKIEFCTEKLDKNGKLIFEGDILLFPNKKTQGSVNMTQVKRLLL